MRLLHADAIVTAEGSVIRDGAVVVHDDGTIDRVGPAAEVIAASKGATVERVRGVLVPGLVNAHTHVELSALAGRVRGGTGFVSWVDELLGARAEAHADEVESGIESAVQALLRSGTVAVGEVTNTLAAVGPLAAAGIAGSVFHEVFGVVRARVLARVDELARDVADRFGTWPSGELAYAPAPHTLYTTHPDAVRRLFAKARERSARSSVHLLEHREERRAIEQGDGRAAEWLARRVPGAEDVVWPKRPVLDVAHGLGALAPDVLLVHLTDATPAELDRIAKSGAHVVSCPRSNLTIEGRLPPVPAMFAAGLQPALGTDSLASSPSLDVLDEARTLQSRLPELPAEALVRMATWNGARALGRTDLGRIAAGARPGILAFEVEVDPSEDVCELILREATAPRRMVVARAIKVAGAGG